MTRHCFSHTTTRRRPLRLLLFVILSLSTLPAAHGAKRPPPPPPPPPDDAVLASEDLTVAGQLLPVFQKFSITGANIHKVVSALREAIDVKEFAILGILGWASVPLISALHDAYVSIVDRITPTDTSTPEDTKNFTDTYLYHAVNDISNVAQIGALVYGVDCFMVSLNALGFQNIHAGLSKKVAQISYTIWAGLRIARLKKFVLQRKFRSKPDALVKTRLYNRILNTIIAVTTGAIVFDFLELNFGTALKSLLSFGGVGALVISLSSKDVATQVVSGVALSTGDRFLEGDEIQLGDGQAGIIEKMGIAYTDLRGYDEITTRIPNSQLSQQRVRNLSRVTRSQVTQTLWFSYKDMDKMADIMEAIKQEVNATCGEHAILDGSRPFRAHWRDFKNDHLEVVVDFHFNIKAATQAYWDNRMKVLEAIASAVKKMGVEFTFPALITYSGGGGGGGESGGSEKATAAAASDKETRTEKTTYA